MKFVYVDESGEKDHSEVFVMCGLMVDAYRLRKRTEEFEQLIGPILERHQRTITDFKTSKFIQGKSGWNIIEAGERQEFLRTVCELAVTKGDKIVGLALSFSALEEAIDKSRYPHKPHHWQVSAMFIASLIQKEMQRKKGKKGLTVFIVDDNKVQMPLFSNELHARREWFDGLYQVRKKSVWKPRSHKNRFDQIINTAFAIKSDHATLIQVADVICYVYRRHLELTSEGEVWSGEQQFYSDLFQLLESQRLKLGHCPADSECVKFYKKAKHREWAL